MTIKKDFEEWWEELRKNKGKTGYRNDDIIYRYEKKPCYTTWKNCVRFYKKKKASD
jgi:hypothetical protein